MFQSYFFWLNFWRATNQPPGKRVGDARFSISSRYCLMPLLHGSSSYWMFDQFQFYARWTSIWFPPLRRFAPSAWLHDSIHMKTILQMWNKIWDGYCISTKRRLPSLRIPWKGWAPGMCASNIRSAPVQHRHFFIPVCVHFLSYPYLPSYPTFQSLVHTVAVVEELQLVHGNKLRLCTCRPPPIWRLQRQ